MAFVVLGPRWILDWDLGGAGSGDRAKAVTDVRESLLKAFGGLAVIAGATATWRQLKLNRHSQVTDAFSAAITQLGDPVLDVRLGGIYALERIARSSPADLRAVEEVLCLFVKNRPWGTDVDIAVVVLGRRETRKPIRPVQLDRVKLPEIRLRFAVLPEADLHFADLSGAVLYRADLTRADLTGVSLKGAVLVEASLYQADLRDAVLTGALAEGVDLRGADLSRADLTGARLTRAKLTDADLRAADLTDAELTGAVVEGAYVDASTTWPEGFEPEGVVSRDDLPPIRPRDYDEATRPTGS
ncbi:pentapeptide repeat-containing protein [Amycolatopsis sp. NPDC005961]|uniref:pentapeptide repeat-containing protein n=1 Tax=Amycolatopsis sp. NPDC005961 TaxID=3156720 RepID=UPI0033DD7FF9